MLSTLVGRNHAPTAKTASESTHMTLANHAVTRDWIATPYDGIDIAPVGGESTVNTAAYRIRGGLQLPAHPHPVWELVTVLSGKLRLGAATLSAGDVLHTSAGEAHDVEALEDTVFLVTVGQAQQLG
jgi:quercetin dioxygenase-like cupin family protein